ncbi:glycosyltransferase family 8 protein [Boletus reticuloceps]|uniref:Glycosyltransferase family 8 protein n=1 Tax=Boletus reticuloceps TaxID=495285 RepID=A0A8I2YNR4_9AGAM|nr:glycosyltransferase family 8 protein [Boletus reticuloceps]
MSTLDANTTIGLYEFTPTQDWFSFNELAWQNLFHLVVSEAPRALEIGSWEGRSAVFLLGTLCAKSGELVCIDHFDLLGTAEGRERHRKLTHNLALTGRPARVLPQFSVPALCTLLQEEMNKNGETGFDWIYIDGSHRSDDTLLDAELVWRLARPGCIIIFDDYNWPEQPLDSPFHPRRGIDAFLAVHKGEYERLSTNPDQYQMVIQKKIPMRIGFLLEPGSDGQLYAFEYGINIALVVDAAYAMAAAVTLRSVTEHVQGRITLYIVDCGLLAEDKNKIEASLPTRSDVTLVFVALPPNSLTSTMGPVWAKVDMMKCLPVQRVLYLDADILVRRDLRALWNTDLGGRSLAAAPDVGFPMGHSDVPRGEFFNAGVLLLDLARTRSTLVELEKHCREMADSRFREQDVLNVHFKIDWVALSLEWNAQGLGTYAECTSVDRDKLCLEQMEDPAIVHFTGPVHPTVQVVLNPYVQPYTAKPWGYAGAPGHPYEREWWDMLGKTSWRGWRETTDYKETCDKAKTKALERAKEEFDRRLAGLVSDAP